MVVFGKKWLYSGKSGCIRVGGCNRAKVVVFLQRGCIRAKVVVIGQKWLYSGKCFVQAKVVKLRQKFLCSGKNACIRTK